MTPARLFQETARRFVHSGHAGRLSPAVSVALVLPLLAIVGIGFLLPVWRLVALSFADGAANYQRLLDDTLYLEVFAVTGATAACVTVLCIVLGYPVAYAMNNLKGKAAVLAGACVFIPLWTSVLIRSYAWIILLQRNGALNSLLGAAGLGDHPVKILYTQAAVVLGMTHILLPFAILPIYATLRSLPPDLVRAATNLGAGPVRAFLLITLPLSLPGVFAGTVLCFVMALGFYITPALLGGPGSLLMATLIGQQTTVLLDWPFAAALSTVLLGATLFIVIIFRRAISTSKGFQSVH